jgi:tetratricopeptide (TPR) repeat protein
LPFSRNEFFVGREAQLQSLEKLLSRQGSHQRITISGLGGCGKSALALECAYRAIIKDAKYLVFWVPAISRESFELAYRNIGLLLHLPEITDDNIDVLQLVKNRLESGNLGHWLMIIDNADDASLLLSNSNDDLKLPRLSDYLPRNERGKIIFTSRSKKVAENLTPSNVIKLDDMNVTEARQLMAQRLSEKALLEDEAAVDELLGLLAYLPLAIVQATAFINSNEISISDYISLFRNPTTEVRVFSKHFEDPSRYRETESTIAKTWHISFDQILKQDRLAADYLSFMACIDRINIPQSLLPLGDPLQQVEAIGTLKAYAFITERQRLLRQSKGEKVFDIHRLVHLASMWWLQKHGKWTTWTNKAAIRLEELIPYGGHERKEVWTAYLPHAIHIAGDTLDETKKASLLDRVGRCQASLGQFSIAETTHRQVLVSQNKSLGKDHTKTLTTMDLVGSALHWQGKYEEAEFMHRQTLSMRKKVLGVEHPSTLTTMNNLALVLDGQGKYEEAESMHRQTLAASTKVRGVEHPDTLTAMNNLAGVMGRKGQYEKAELMYRQTLATSEKVLGVEHPDTLTTMNNLAGVLDSQDKYEEAESMHRQTLAPREKVLGVEHPDTLTTMNNLALVLGRQGKYEEAESMHRQTLATSEKMLGFKHPSTLMTMSNLALVLGRQGKYEEAELMYRQTLATSEKVLGVKNPSTLMTMNNLAGVLDSQDKYEEAESMHRQTLAPREKVLGVEHPDTLTTMNNLALVLGRQGKYEEAELMHRQLLATREKVLGVEHPNTLTTMNNLAGVLGRQGKYEEAELMHKQTLATSEKVLGVAHPVTLATVYCFAHLLVNRHRYSESTALYKRACVGFIATLGRDHPTTRACQQLHTQMLSSQEQVSSQEQFSSQEQISSQEQDPMDVPVDIPPSDGSRQTGKKSSLLHRFKKISFGRSKD